MGWVQGFNANLFGEVFQGLILCGRAARALLGCQVLAPSARQ
jgi:hypothetical protein